MLRDRATIKSWNRRWAPSSIIFRKRTNHLVNNYENNWVFLKKFTLKTRFKREKYRSMADKVFLIFSTNGRKSLPLLMFAWTKNYEKCLKIPFFHSLIKDNIERLRKIQALQMFLFCFYSLNLEMVFLRGMAQKNEINI